jgi:hypothetical protein
MTSPVPAMSDYGTVTSGAFPALMATINRNPGVTTRPAGFTPATLIVVAFAGVDCASVLGTKRLPAEGSFIGLGPVRRGRAKTADA